MVNYDFGFHLLYFGPVLTVGLSPNALDDLWSWPWSVKNKWWCSRVGNYLLLMGM